MIPFAETPETQPISLIIFIQFILLKEALVVI